MSSVKMINNVPPSTQYLHPDYVQPLPTSTEKKSPLAMLAQTCNNIGKDMPPHSKSPVDLSAAKVNPVLIKQESDKLKKAESPREHHAVSSPLLRNPIESRNSIVDLKHSTSSVMSSFPQPAIAPLNPLADRHAPIAHPAALPPISPLSYLPFLGHSFPHLEALMKPEALSAYYNSLKVPPPSMFPSSPSECRDPHCTTCYQRAQMSALLAAANCTKCQQLSPHHGLLSPSHPHPPQAHSQHTCNWMVAGSKCGKTFATREQLLQHVQTHTLDANVPSAPAVSLSSSSNGCGGHFGHSLSPNSRLSSLSPSAHSRFHPYTRPSVHSSLGLGVNPLLLPYASSLYSKLGSTAL